MHLHAELEHEQALVALVALIYGSIVQGSRGVASTRGGYKEQQEKMAQAQERMSRAR